MRQKQDEYVLAILYRFHDNRHEQAVFVVMSPLPGLLKKAFIGTSRKSLICSIVGSKTKLFGCRCSHGLACRSSLPAGLPGSHWKSESWWQNRSSGPLLTLHITHNKFTPRDRFSRENWCGQICQLIACWRGPNWWDLTTYLEGCESVSGSTPQSLSLPQPINLIIWRHVTRQLSMALDVKQKPGGNFLCYRGMVSTIPPPFPFPRPKHATQATKLRSHHFN